VFTVLFLGLIGFLYYIRDVILQVFVALLIMTILNPMVTRLHKLKVPRLASVLVVYVLVLGVFAGALAIMVPPFIEQTSSFASNLPQYMEELRLPAEVTASLEREVTSQIGKLPSQVVKISVSVFSNVLAVFTVLIFALYFLISREKLNEQLTVMFNDGIMAKRVDRVLNKLEYKLGGWMRAHIFLMGVVGMATYVGLIIIGVPFALPLAFLAGLLEIIPNVGPTVAAVPAVIIGFAVSPLTGLAAAALGILIQQVENYALVPKVMEKSVGVNPIITLFSLIVGLKLAGIMGAILSVPVVITTQVLLEEFVYEAEKSLG